MCSRTVKDAHGQLRHKYGCPRTLYGSYTDPPRSSRMLPSSRVVETQQCSLELPKTAVLVSRCPKDIDGRSKTYKDRHGATRRLHWPHATLAIWDWGLVLFTITLIINLINVSYYASVILTICCKIMDN
ncbi:hypothetical protein DPMN_133947 [Dreissena polymorpha]|uniref:Uncharacterized protein n=1 Tax=Dreissena polymorpha TaxID=45954 RepID=A0A9D4JFC0_DREPO|nr:hypothetical protein DPMN_133947 [Dreissena polymorpha]